MSISAIVPVDKLLAANAVLEGPEDERTGWGPSNFSVAAYTGPQASHAALNVGGYIPGFLEALEAIDGVVIVTDERPSDDPEEPAPAAGHAECVNDLIEDQGAIWGDHVPDLPDEGMLNAGEMFKEYGFLWAVIQSFDVGVYDAGVEEYPALIRRVRNPHVPEPWHQPMDQYDSYKLVNPFTGEPDRTLWDGEVYATKIDNNTYSPTDYPAGWELIE